MEHRNLYGYGENPPHANWPGSARVAVSMVVNVEEGSERAVSRGDERNEPVYDMIEEIAGAPNPSMESHFDYGTRAGYWRIVRVLARYGVPCTLNACAEALERAPWIARDALARGHEISCHGYRWMTPLHMSEDEERAWIAKAVETIRKVAGVRPVGWHTRCPHTFNTRRLLVEEGGFLYDSDAYDDDLPYLVEVGGRRHVVLPYSLDTNDMRFQRPEAGFVCAEDFADYVSDAFDWLWEEGESVPKMMTVGLHLRIIGRPGRIAGLDRVLEHMTDRGSVWFATRREIAEHWLREHGRT
ncbi:MAG: polysaccharide deacetylase family protein [Proteobacteria bacterium]|nr:polysaccharide deacetylase family protein [Pseudomonadota bacterium]